MRPKNGDFRPKNKNDHNILNISWIPKTIRATLTSFFSNPLPQIKYKEILMRKKRVIQAGAKSQTGGKKPGFLSSANQVVGIAGAVKNEPITPANWQIKIEIINLPILFNFIFFSPAYLKLNHV